MINDELLKNLASIASRNVAGDAFKQAMTMPKIYTISDHLQAMFSSSGSINDLAKEIVAWEKEAPGDKHLAVMMRTPNGAIMDVEKIRPNGWQFFIAEGYIQGMPCKVAGHIATLSLFCSYEETRKGKSPAGFTIVTESLNQPQPLPESESQDSTTRIP
jgi:hypothetical protein